MATIDDKTIIDTIIANDGYYPEDPRVFMIVEYTNFYGNTAWGVTWPEDRNKYKYLVESEYVQNPKVIWKAPNNL